MVPANASHSVEDGKPAVSLVIRPQITQITQIKKQKTFYNYLGSHHFFLPEPGSDHFFEQNNPVHAGM
jgi:hypothetical protein